MTVSMKERRRTSALTSASGLAMLALIIILVNVLSNWVFKRWDMTSSQIYTLSPSSKRLVKQLDDRFIIKAYFTPDLPPPYNMYERYVRDMLTEYRIASGGRLQFQFIPTHPLSTFEQEAGSSGLIPLQFEQSGSDQLAIHRGFMGLVLFYGDKTDAIPAVQDIPSFEYVLTSHLARMTLKSKKTILLATGHGESNWHENPNSKLSQDVSQLYTIQNVSLQPATTAPLQGDALFIIGPRGPFDEKSLWTIDQAIMHGIPTAFLVDNKNVMVQRFAIAPLATGLNELLAHYGAVLGSQVVCDLQCQAVGLTQNYGGMALTSSVRYPVIPQIAPLDKKSPMLRGIDGVSLPFTVTVTPSAALPSTVRFIPLFQSSERSWLIPAETSNVAPNAILPPLPDAPHGPYNLGSLLEGSFTSYFQGRPNPFPNQPLTAVSPKTQIFVLGTSHVLDPSIPEFPGTEGLLTNLMAYLSHDETLLGIRAKGEVFRPLKPISLAARNAVKIFCLLGVPLLSVLMGLLRWQRRARWRDTISTRFAPKSVGAGIQTLPPPLP